MRIGELSAETGIPAKTMRHYEDIALLPDPARTASDYPDYDPSAIGRLSFIRPASARRPDAAAACRIIDATRSA